MVDVAKEVGADAVSHGCTGKGNDQVYLLTYYVIFSISFTKFPPFFLCFLMRKDEVRVTSAKYTFHWSHLIL